MQIVIDEKDFTRNKPYRVEIEFDDEKVAEILKCARITAKDEIINNSDVISWIPSAVKGSIYLSFPGTDRFYYIHPRSWKMDIISVLNDDKLSSEIITEICFKTAKHLTVLLQADLKMHEDPPSIEEFVKDFFLKNPDTLTTVTEFLGKLVDCTNIVAENLSKAANVDWHTSSGLYVSKEPVLMNRSAINYFANALNGDVCWDIPSGKTSCTVNHIEGGIMVRSEFLAKENGLYELINTCTN